MSKVAIVFGLLLVAIGVFAYLGIEPKSKPTTQTTGGEAGQTSAAAEPAKRSLTALIPAGFGVLLMICGGVGLNPMLRKHAMHGAAATALLGVILGGGRFASKLPALFNGDPNLNQRAVVFTGILGLVCLIFLILSVRSFIAARKQRSTPK